jgi:hypothetical protein
MDPSTFSDPIEQLQWIINTQWLETINKQRLTSVKTSIEVSQRRNEEMMKEKERKILILEFQVTAKTTENTDLEEKVKQLERANAILQEENAMTAQLAELYQKVEARTVTQGELIKHLEQKVALMEKKLNTAEQVQMRLKERENSRLRQHRRIAIKLLSSVMELDGDVALPGKQRHISARRSPEAPSAPSKHLQLLRSTIRSRLRFLPLLILLPRTRNYHSSTIRMMAMSMSLEMKTIMLTMIVSLLQHRREERVKQPRILASPKLRCLCVR